MHQEISCADKRWLILSMVFIESNILPINMALDIDELRKCALLLCIIKISVTFDMKMFFSRMKYDTITVVTKWLNASRILVLWWLVC